MDGAVLPCMCTQGPHGTEASGDGKQRELVCDQRGVRVQLSLCFSISTQNSERLRPGLPDCYEGIFFNEGKIKLS